VTSAVLTPFVRGKAAQDSARWWKRLLPVGEIDYKGRKITFSRDYLQGLAQSFNDQAYDQVPFQLAGDDNKHTNDVERFGGQVAAMQLRNDGLWIGLDPTERGEKVLRDNPNLGVSARIVEGYSRSDGKFYPKAVQHVLATLDPRIPGLGGWSAVEAANDVAVTIDLSGAQFSGEEEAPMPELTEDQQARLAKLLEIDPDQLSQAVAGLSEAQVGQLTGEDDLPEMSDEELDAIVDEAVRLEAAGLLDLDEDGDLEPAAAGTGLSNTEALALELAQTTGDENARQLKIISDQLDHERWLAERRKLTGSGVPPFIADLAQPLLEGAGHTVDLSGGNTVDAGQIMRKVLTEYAKLGDQLGIDVELGSPMDQPDDGEPAGEAARNDVVSRFKSQAFGIS
jgi:hypothetical protein